MRISSKSISLAVITGVLISLSFFAFFDRSSEENGTPPSITSMLPAKLPGWSLKDLPVGETEEVRQRMGELLDYDAAIYREYKKGLVTVQVYISYWTPGKAHFRLVYGHTPDVCWVRAGWKPTVQDPAYVLILDTDPPLTLKEGQYREFTVGKEHLRVVFWQLLDGEPFTYGNFGAPPASAIFTDILSRGFNQKPEQWFIRISSNVDFDQLKADIGFQTLIRSMTNFGLDADSTMGNQ
jgi:hypothetical protein